MDETVAAHVRRGQQLTMGIGLGSLVLYAAIFIAHIYEFISNILAFIMAIFILLSSIRFFRLREELQIVTDYSPARVREKFQNVDNPLAIYPRTLTDDDNIKTEENGATYVRSWLFGLYTVKMRYKTRKRSDGDLLMQVAKNGSEYMEATISVEPSDDTGSRVIVEGRYLVRLSLRTLALIWVRQNHTVSALKADGYEIVESETRIGLR
jgi:hypothetical protein